MCELHRVAPVDGLPDDLDARLPVEMVVRPVRMMSWSSAMRTWMVTQFSLVVEWSQ